MSATTIEAGSQEPDLSGLDPDVLFEIIDGQIVELHMSVESIAIGNQIVELINAHVRAHQLGRAFNEMIIKLPLKRDRNRRPDGIYVSNAKWPADKPFPQTAAWAIVPEICIEVVSPTDMAKELDEKVAEYLQSGVSQVWVVHPSTAKVTVYEGMDRLRVVYRHQLLEAGPIIPGLKIALADVLPAVEILNGQH